MELKPRQQEAFNAVFDALERGVDRQLLQLPTGVGKTAVACHIAKQFQCVLFLVHRQELVDQTYFTMKRVDPERPIGHIVQGQHDIQPFTIGMIPTVHRRLERIDPAAFDLVVVDECHRAMARTHREVCEHFNSRLRLGLTATPERMDGASLDLLFSEITYSMEIAAAVREGYLTKPVAFQCLTSISLEKVRTLGGDFNESDLASVIDVDSRNQYVVNKYRQYADGRRAIAFAVGIDHAMHLAEAFNAAGIPADWIAGNSPDRAEKIARFDAGEIQVLTNCMILVEGFDSTGIEAVLLARPTKSRPLFAQMIGRGLRLHPGKESCIVIDFTDNAGRHSLASAWRWLGYEHQPQDEEPREIADEHSQRQSKVVAVDLEREINLLTPPPDLPPFTGAWTGEPATEKQLQYLASLGYDMEADYSKGGAAMLISNHPASVWQLKKLEQWGYDVSVPWTRGQFSKAMERHKETMLSALTKIRQAGFVVEVKGSKVQISPQERLSQVQAHWVERHKAGLLMALRD